MGLFDAIFGTNTSDGTQAAVSAGQLGLTQGANRGNRILDQTTGQAVDAVKQGATGATGAINTNYGGARSDLTNYGGQAQGLLSSGIGNAVGTVQGSNGAYQPYVASGGAANGMLSNALGLNGPGGNATATSAFQAGPGYQWNLDQSTDAVARKAAALGMAASGNTATAIQDRAANLANQEYGNWLTNLQGLGTQGLTAASGISANNQAAGGYQYGGATTGAQLDQALGTSLGNLGVNQGNQLAGIQTGMGSSLGSLYQNLGQAKSGNITNAALGSANLGIIGGQAEDAAANANSGLISKALGSFLSPITGAASKSFGGLVSGATGGYL